MKELIATLITVSFVTGCVETTTPPITNVTQPAELRCSGYGGFEGRVCPVSIYSLIANPTTYYGKTIAFKGYVHKSSDGTIAVYPSRESAESSEIASSLLCASVKASCENYVGKYAELFGLFTDRSIPDFFFEPVGTVELVYVRSVKDVAGR